MCDSDARPATLAEAGVGAGALPSGAALRAMQAPEAEDTSEHQLETLAVRAYRLQQ